MIQFEMCSASTQPPSRRKRHNISLGSEPLTRSDIEALRRRKKQLAAYMLAEFADWVPKERIILEALHAGDDE